MRVHLTSTAAPVLVLLLWCAGLAPCARAAGTPCTKKDDCAAVRRKKHCCEEIHNNKNHAYAQTIRGMCVGKRDFQEICSPIVVAPFDPPPHNEALNKADAGVVTQAIIRCYAATSNEDKQAAYGHLHTVLTDADLVKKALDQVGRNDEGRAAWRGLIAHVMEQRGHACNDKHTLVESILNDFLDQVSVNEIVSSCEYGDVQVKGVAYKCVRTFKASVAWLLAAVDADAAAAPFLVLKKAGDTEIDEWAALNEGGVTSPFVCSMQAQEADIVVTNSDGSPAAGGENKFIILDYVPGDTLAEVAKGHTLKWNSGDLKRCTEGVIKAIDFTYQQTGGVPDDNHWENIITEMTDDGRICKLIDVAGLKGKQFGWSLVSFKAPSSTGHKAFCGVFESDLVMDEKDPESDNTRQDILNFWCAGEEHLKEMCGEAYENFDYTACWAIFEASSGLRGSEADAEADAEGDAEADAEEKAGADAKFSSYPVRGIDATLDKVNSVLEKELDLLLRGNRADNSIRSQ